jgi:hypothetical protein
MIAREASDMICRATPANMQYSEHFSRDPLSIKGCCSGISAAVFATKNILQFATNAFSMAGAVTKAAPCPEIFHAQASDRRRRAIIGRDDVRGNVVLTMATFEGFQLCREIESARRRARPRQAVREISWRATTGVRPPATRLRVSSVCGFP